MDDGVDVCACVMCMSVSARAMMGGGDHTLYPAHRMPKMKRRNVNKWHKNSTDERCDDKKK